MLIIHNKMRKQREMIKVQTHRRAYASRGIILSVVSLCLTLLLFNLVSGLHSEINKDKYTPLKQNTDFTFSFTDNSAGLCNLTTIDYPQGIIWINKSISQAGFTYNYKVNAGNFTNAGTYCLNLACSNGTGNICREVTSTGFLGTTGFYFIMIALIIGMFILGFVLKNNYIMTLASISVLFLGFFIIKFGIDFLKDVQTTWAIGLIVWAIGIICIFKSAEEQLKEFD